MDELKPKAPKYIVLDIETTGLDPDLDGILEVGAIAIDELFRVVGAVDFVVRPTEPQLDRLVNNDFVKKMHTENHLIEVLQDGLEPWAGDEALSTWLRFAQGCEPGSVILAGHTISFDHGFIKKQFPLSAKMLSHRTLDFSAMTRLLRDLDFPIPNNEMPHRAMADALIEYDELKAMVETLSSYRSAALTLADVYEAIGKVQRSLEANALLRV